MVFKKINSYLYSLLLAMGEKNAYRQETSHKCEIIGTMVEKGATKIIFIYQTCFGTLLKK